MTYVAIGSGSLSRIVKVPFVKMRLCSQKKITGADYSDR
jgi:hypothetical protein